MKPVIILGCGGHAKVLIEALRLMKVPIAGVVDANPGLNGRSFFGIPIIGGDGDVLRRAPETVLLVNGVGSVRQPERRTALFENFQQKGYRFQTIVHPSVVICSDTRVEEGAQIMAGAIIQPGVRVGSNAIVNTRATVDHDCIIGQHAHLAPGVTLSGGVTVGNRAHIGTGATIIQGITIGIGSLVAAGAVVTADVPDGVTVMGVPARMVLI